MGVIFRLIFVSSPVADSSGALPVAAFVTSNWFTAELVVWNIICSLPFSSPIKWASSNNILWLLVSRLPPNWGVVSSTTFDIAPDAAKPETTVLLVIFFNPPPEVSTARKTSSLATEDISLNDPTAIELKFVPSAIRRLPEVFVPIVMSSPDTVRSPGIVTLPLASWNIILLAGKVINTSFDPEDRFTALLLFELAITVVLASVVPEAVKVPNPTSKSLLLASTIA